jgi:hypothetical protein
VDMRRISVLIAVAGILIQTISPAEASVIKYGNLNITLPDTVTITGAEVGTGARNCSFKVSVDADPGTTIPLRAMVVVNLIDALGTTIDNNYSQATVEGLTHQEFTGVFHCNASVGTLKAPYKFSGSVLGVPSSGMPFIEAPANVVFVNSAPAPSPSSAPTSTQSDAQALSILAQYTPKVATLEKLKEQVQTWFAQYPNFFTANPDLKAGLQKALDFKEVTAPTQNDVDALVGLLLGDNNQQGLVPLKTQVEALITRQISQDLAAAKSGSKNSITITCIKGKQVKKVTSNKPKCPAGFKKK